MAKRIWITWENQRRNHSISKALNAKLIQFDIKFNRVFRYPVAITKTLITFIKERPNLIFAQNPSIVLALVATIYGRIFNIPIIVDAHNAGVFPFNGNKMWANKLADFIFRASNFTVVTNSILAEHIIKRGGKPVILPDPIPELRYCNKKRVLNGKFNILFICSWSEDEPYEEVIKAAKFLDKDVHIYITGNSKGKEKQMGIEIPKNIVFTGFLQEEDFIEILFSCDVVMDLTKRTNCLVCGAYEGVAAEKPLIISNTEVLRKYFYKGALYTNNTYKDLLEKINVANINKNLLKREIVELKNELIITWNNMKDEFEKLIKVYNL